MSPNMFLPMGALDVDRTASVALATEAAKIVTDGKGAVAVPVDGAKVLVKVDTTALPDAMVGAELQQAQANVQQAQAEQAAAVKKVSAGKWWLIGGAAVAAYLLSR